MIIMIAFTIWSIIMVFLGIIAFAWMDWTLIPLFTVVIIVLSTFGCLHLSENKRKKDKQQCMDRLSKQPIQNETPKPSSSLDATDFFKTNSTNNTSTPSSLESMTFNEKGLKLLDGSKKGDINIVKECLNCGADVNFTDLNDVSALHYAAKNRCPQLVTYLIEKGARKETTDRYCRKPLHWATLNQHMSVVSVLLKAKVDVNCKDLYSKGPLHYATANADYQLLALLIENEANVNLIDGDGNTSLHIATSKGYIKAVSILLKNKANIDAQNIMGETALHIAAGKGHTTTLTVLLKYNPKLDVPDINGYTPILRAKDRGYLNAFVLLYKTGANFSMIKKKGLPFALKMEEIELSLDSISLGTNINCMEMLKLIDGSQRGDINTVKDFLNCGADINFADPFGLSPLHYAAKNGHEQLVTFLLENGAFKEITGRYYRKPLHWATLNQHIRVVSILLKAKVDANCKDLYSKGPLHYATANADYQLLALLIEYETDIDLNDGDGNTSLHIATSKGYTKAVSILLNNRANVDAQNNMGETALHIAARKGDFATLTVLLMYDPKLDVLDIMGYTAILRAKDCGHTTSFLLLSQEKDVTEYVSLGAYINYMEVMSTCTERFMIDARLKLINGSQRGDISSIKEALNCGADINFIDFHGLSPLHYAAKNGHKKIVAFLLKCGAFKEITGRYYRKPLHWATLNMYPNVVSILLKAKVHVNCKDVYSKTPLHYAAANVDYHSLALLTKHEADANLNDLDGNTSLHIATSKGYTKAISILLKHKANVDAQNNMNETVLHIAAKIGDTTILTELLMYNPKLNVLDIMGYTPILRAEYFSNADAFILLYEAGSNFSIIKNKRLVLALKRGSIEKAQECLSLGADINYMEQAQELFMIFCSPCLSPTREEMKDVVNAFVSHHPYTALHYAACLRNRKVVTFLMKHKARVDLRTIDGKTSLHFASSRSDTEVIKIILEHLSHNEAIKCVNYQDSQGNTTLHNACSNGSLELIRYLLQTGYVRPLLKNNLGYTAIQMVPPDHPNQYDIIMLFDPFQQGIDQCPIDSYTKLFMCGKSSVGKSSLTQVIFERSTKSKDETFTQNDIVTEVTPKTAGIIPHEIQSHEIGNVILHDFAGHPEYYNSHSAVLESLMLRSPGGFILIVDLRDDREIIKRDLYFWINFIENVSCRIEKKSELLVVGSHPDLLNPDSVSTYQPYIDSIISEILKNQEYRGFFAVDCRRPGGNAIDRFMRNLSMSCQALLNKSESISYYCFVLNAFLHAKLDVVALTLEQLVKNIKKENTALMPSTPSDVTDLLSTLSDKGLILFINNGTSNWVIIKKSTLLSEVNGILFAPKSIEQVHKNIASNTGVVPLSALKEVFPAYDADMIVNFLLSLEFCHVVDSGVLEMIQTNVASPASISEKLLFFSSLVLEDRPESIQISEGYGWCLFCPRPNQFLSSRFVSLLLLHLAYTHCLRNRGIGQLKSSNQLQQLAVSCDIWRNGIRWMKGVEVVVQVSEHNRCVTVLVSEGDPVLCNEIRSSLIKEIVALREELCPACYVEECIISPKSIKLALTSNIASLSVCPIQDVANDIITRDENVYNNKGQAVDVRAIVGQCEPYCAISPLLICALFDNKMANKFLSQDVVEHVIKVCTTLKLKIMLTKCTTYQSLRKQLNKFSIFAGQNPLTLAGNLTEDDIRKYSETTYGILNFVTKGTNDAHSAILGKRPVKRDILVLLANIEYLWHEIGEALELKFGSLQNHLYSPYSNSTKLSLVIQEWMDSQKTSDVTWSTIIEAVECPIVKQISLGEKMRNYLCQPDVQSQYLEL